MKPPTPAVLVAFAAVIALGATLGVLSARNPAPVEDAAPAPAFTPGFVVPAPSPSVPLATFTPGPEPTATTGALPTDRLPQVRFTLTTASGTVVAVLPVEVPPASEYGIGLSGRRALDRRGMVFYYPDGKGSSGFWMKNTHVDLDIAFVDASQTVIAIMQMKADTETVHRPAVPYLAAIEAPSGYYQGAGITAGARVEFLFDIADAARR